MITHSLIMMAVGFMALFAAYLQIIDKSMNEPRTLHEYIEMRNLQRKRENCLINEAKNVPNPLSLDKEKKIDQMMIEIFDYIRHLLGEGPIFNRFKMLMQNLYKTFQRELTQFHNIGVVNRFKTDQKYIEDMKKANSKLNDYLQKCEQDQKAIDVKYQKLAKDNRDLNNNMIFINRNNSKKVEVEDNFEDEQVVERTEKVGKITRIEPEVKNLIGGSTPKKPESVKQANIRMLKPPDMKEPKTDKPASKISNFFTNI